MVDTNYFSITSNFSLKKQINVLEVYYPLPSPFPNSTTQLERARQTECAFCLCIEVAIGMQQAKFDGT